MDQCSGIPAHQVTFNRPCFHYQLQTLLEWHQRKSSPMAKQCDSYLLERTIKPTDKISFNQQLMLTMFHRPPEWRRSVPSSSFSVVSPLHPKLWSSPYRQSLFPSSCMQKIWSRICQMPRNSLIVLKLTYGDHSVNIMTRMRAIYGFMLVCVHMYVDLPQQHNRKAWHLAPFAPRFDGPFIVQGHIHGRQDLLELRHEITPEITGQHIGAVNNEKISLHLQQPTGPSPWEGNSLSTSTNPPSPTPAPSKSVSSDVAKEAFAFGQFLHPLPITKHMFPKWVKWCTKPGQKREIFSPDAENWKDLYRSAPTCLCKAVPKEEHMLLFFMLNCLMNWISEPSRRSGLLGNNHVVLFLNA